MRGEGHLVYGVTVAAQNRVRPTPYEPVPSSPHRASPRPASSAACTHCPQLHRLSVMFVLKNKETLRALVDAVIGTLSKVIEGWF